MAKINIPEIIFSHILVLLAVFGMSYIFPITYLKPFLSDNTWLLQGLVINIIMFFTLGKYELKDQKEKNKLNRLLGE